MTSITRSFFRKARDFGNPDEVVCARCGRIAKDTAELWFVKGDLTLSFCYNCVLEILNKEAEANGH
jgi:hypothetical protein